MIRKLKGFFTKDNNKEEVRIQFIKNGKKLDISKKNVYDFFLKEGIDSIQRGTKICEYFGIDPISGAPVNIESYDISMAIAREGGGKAEIFLTPGDGLTLTNNKLKILLTPEQTKLIPGRSISDVRFKKDGITFFGLFFSIECNPAVTR